MNYRFYYCDKCGPDKLNIENIRLRNDGKLIDTCEMHLSTYGLEVPAPRIVAISGDCLEEVYIPNEYGIFGHSHVIRASKI